MQGNGTGRVAPLGADRRHPPRSDGDDDAAGLRAALSSDGRSAIRPGVARLGHILHPADGSDQDPGPLPRGRQHPPGPGRADGGAIGAARGSEHRCGPDFSQPVPKGGYVWWYVDGLSDDGSYALTVIAFIGSVFSSYYAASRRFGDGDPLNHCAVNVALYGRSSKHWALTERTRSDLTRDASTLSIGPSALRWKDDALTIDIDEITVPFPSRIKGRVTIRPEALVARAFALDAAERHSWHPIAPRARIEVALESPKLSWSGNGYLDCNFGDEPLEAAFREWDWARAKIGNDTLVLYDVTARDGDELSLALRFDGKGGIETFDPPPRAALSGTFWRIARHARSVDASPRLIKTLEDTPFYARSLVGATIGGEPVVLVHESLSLDRVKNPIVRAMLPFRMPRRRWHRG